MASAYERMRQQLEGTAPPPEPDPEFRKQAPHIAKLFDMVREQDSKWDHGDDGGGGGAPPAPGMG